MSRVLKGLGVVALVLAIGVGGAAAWVDGKSEAVLAQQFDTHRVDIPVPWPLSEAELAALRAEQQAAQGEPDPALVNIAGEGQPPAEVDPLAGIDLQALALERAVARGEHLVNARYACVECHGADFGGGVMVDDPAIGTLRGRNITTGKGSVTTSYTMADWDRLLRHGVKPDGTGSVMPSEDFKAMSDQELSDVVAFIRSRPPVDAEVPPPQFGPVGKVLLALGQFPLFASTLEDHEAAHRVTPPEAAVSVEFGEHLAQVCTGCHNAQLSGGPMPGMPPDWAMPRNLTPHADGLAGWTYEQFTTAMREGKRPDGSALLPPMTGVVPYAQRMTDTELQALWTYLQQVPAQPTPKG